MSTTIVTCSCKHEYQDKTYGKGRRVANQTTKDGGKVYRCTVCRAESKG
jgi:hypothetical protein